METDPGLFLRRLSPGIADLVACLQRKGVSVYLVSGGFRQMIEVQPILRGLLRRVLTGEDILPISCPVLLILNSFPFTSVCGGSVFARASN